MPSTVHLIVASLLLLVFTEHLAVCKLITMKMMKRVHHEQKEGFIHPHYLGVNRAASDVDTPLYGAINVTAEYYAAVELGKSKQSFTVQVDTGSSTLAVPATGCTQWTSTLVNTGDDCGHNNPFYTMDSATVISCAQFPGCICQDKVCMVELAYGDGSFLVGPMVQDEVTVAGISTTAHFGAVKAESQAFGSRTTDGIMGIAYTKLSAQDGDSIIDKLVSDGLIDNAFGMCLGYTGGIFTLGGYDTAYSAGPMTYTPIIDESYYVVQVTDILLGTTSIGVNVAGLNGNHSIVDSGTTLLILNDPAFDGLISMFQSAVCPTLPPSIAALCHPNSQGNSLFTPGICYALTLSDIMLFPNITIQLKGAAPLTIGPLQYFLGVSGGFCWGISPSGGLGTILGDVFMQAFNIHFDRANKQVGFAPVQNCIGVAGTLSVAGGDSQSGPAGKQLSDPLKVQVVYENGKPVIGAIVTFEVESGSADFTKPNAVTDSNGYATTTVTPRSFGSITVKATLFTTDSSASFTLKGTGLPLVAIIGIVVGGVVLIVAVTVIVYLIRKRIHKHRHGYMSVNAHD